MMRSGVGGKFSKTFPRQTFSSNSPLSFYRNFQLYAVNSCFVLSSKERKITNKKKKSNCSHELILFIMCKKKVFSWNMKENDWISWYFKDEFIFLVFFSNPRGEKKGKIIYCFYVKKCFSCSPRTIFRVQGEEKKEKRRLEGISLHS
jgi:hypothetical protein